MVLNYYNVWIMQAINQGLRNALLERWHRLSLTYHGDHRVGDSVYRIFQDSAQVTNVIAVVMRMAQTLIMYLMTLLFVTALDPVLGTLILVVSGFALLWGRWFSPRIRRRSLSARESNAALTSRVQEIFSNIRLIKAHGGEDLEQRRFETDSVTAFNAAFRLRFFTALVTILMFTVAALVFMGGPSKAPIIPGSSTGLRSLSMVARRRR